MMVNSKNDYTNEFNSFDLDNPVIFSRPADQQADVNPVNCSDKTFGDLRQVSYIEILLSYAANTANWMIALEISADELTPLAYSKARLFKAAQYGLFVEICADSVLYTIRKFGKRGNQTGYFDIIERDSECFEAFYFNSWAIYANG